LPEGDVVLLGLGAETLTVCSLDAGAPLSDDGGMLDGGGDGGR
jgi:hypothetical protein